MRSSRVRRNENVDRFAKGSGIINLQKIHGVWRVTLRCPTSNGHHLSPKGRDYPVMSIRMSLQVQRFPLLAMTFSLSRPKPHQPCEGWAAERQTRPQPSQGF